MDAQAKINGATGGDDTARSATTKLVRSQSEMFRHHLELEQVLWPITFIAVRSNIWPMYCLSLSLGNFYPESYSLACKLCQKIGGVCIDDQNWHRRVNRCDRCAQTGQSGLVDFVKMQV
ncbi:hypothetical protein GQ55_3G414200 [Panicum hallii var. hallii]|uniref:Uncharacterized protein n=1 Tax=Panicum hallii var. hallii TaxID=1504633 RepID=A0A2T7EHA5_9POAL|nr:hypothetical protein GQ55_3G414200 [Panicum hallii var. hallii]